jgi:hypothetical protein
MTTLDIQYSREFELARVKNCVSNLEWYVENGYKVSLPDNITAESTEDEILTRVEDQYDEGAYSKFSSELLLEWQKFSVQFEKVKAEASITFNDTYTVFLTRYGTGGSFNSSPSQVTLKIEGKTAKNTLGTLVHEMVHIAIHEHIQKYAISHWKKERLVDLIVEHYFPGLRPMQIIGENVDIVDIAFKEHFPEIESIAEILGDNNHESSV